MLRIQSGIAYQTRPSGRPEENDSSATDAVRHDCMARTSADIPLGRLSAGRVATAAHEVAMAPEASAEAPSVAPVSERAQVDPGSPTNDEASPAPESPWTGGLRGRVVTSAGAPAAGATVRLKKQIGEEEAVALGMPWTGTPIDHSEEARCDDTGMFLLEHVPPLSDCQLEVAADQDLVARKSASVIAARLNHGIGGRMRPERASAMKFFSEMLAK